jgi:hypothetical protein
VRRSAPSPWLAPCRLLCQPSHLLFCSAARWHDKGNSETYDSVKGGELCGGVPFFFNKLTGNSVCGARPSDVLKIWATTTEKIGEKGVL